ncbi:MAG: cytidylate kinase-like family protein [Bacteroidales bacterium]|nr:cytidylate kinase-like family protein [Bacteroidales bacterium]
MTSYFLKYMANRHLREEELKIPKDPGPVITISREFGCPSKIIAKLLTETINKKNREKRIKKQWKWISKEILEESAKELGLDASKIEYVFKYEKRGFMDDILSSHSKKYYKSDKKIRMVIAEVVRTIGEKGNVIIVGRGGVAVTKDIPKSFHIKLEAPIEWRALLTSEKHDLSFKKAKKFALDSDKKREEFRNSFYGKDTDYTTFDITFNCMTMTNEEIITSIIKILELRDFF